MRWITAIPVYNEAQTLPIMFRRLLPVMDGYGKPYEVIFVNDGSHDDSQTVLADLFRQLAHAGPLLGVRRGGCRLNECERRLRQHERGYERECELR